MGVQRAFEAVRHYKITLLCTLQELCPKDSYYNCIIVIFIRNCCCTPVWLEINIIAGESREKGGWKISLISSINNRSQHPMLIKNKSSVD